MVYLNLRAFIMSKTSFALMVMVLMCLYILPIMSLFWQVDMIYMHFIAVYAISQNFTICPKHVLGIIKLMFIGYEMFFVMLCARLYFSPYHVCYPWNTHTLYEAQREPQVGQLSNYDNGMLHIYQNISAKWPKDDKVYSYNWTRTMNIL